MNSTTIITFLLAFVACCNLTAQHRLNFIIDQNPKLVVEAGENQSLIIGRSVTLGGSPSATGGDGNYTFAWLPSDHLNDATLSNPTANPEEPITYSLTVTDGNNCSCSDTVSVSIITSLNNGLELEEFAAYPNPASGKLHIRFSSPEALKTPTIQLIGMDGKVLYEKRYRNSQEVQESISVNFLARGIYFIRIEDGGRAASKKIIIR